MEAANNYKAEARWDQNYKISFAITWRSLDAA